MIAQHRPDNANDQADSPTRCGLLDISCLVGAEEGVGVEVPPPEEAGLRRLHPGEAVPRRLHRVVEGALQLLEAEEGQGRQVARRWWYPVREVARRSSAG